MLTAKNVNFSGEVVAQRVLVIQNWRNYLHDVSTEIPFEFVTNFSMYQALNKNYFTCSGYLHKFVIIEECLVSV